MLTEHCSLYKYVVDRIMTDPVAVQGAIRANARSDRARERDRHDVGSSCLAGFFFAKRTEQEQGTVSWPRPGKECGDDDAEINERTQTNVCRRPSNRAVFSLRRNTEAELMGRRERGLGRRRSASGFDGRGGHSRTPLTQCAALLGPAESLPTRRLLLLLRLLLRATATSWTRTLPQLGRPGYRASQPSTS